MTCELVIINYFRMTNVVDTVDMNDTFLDFDHVKESFDGYKVSSSFLL